MNPMSRVAGQVGGYMAESFKGNVRSTIDIAKGVGQGAALVGGMAVKSMASSASSASQPGSNTRQMMHAASLPISYGGGLLASGAQAAGTKAIDLTKGGAKWPSRRLRSFWKLLPTQRRKLQRWLRALPKQPPRS